MFGAGFGYGSNAASADLLELAEAAVKYDAAIRARAHDGLFERGADGSASTSGEDLDDLYLDWLVKARGALEKWGRP